MKPRVGASAYFYDDFDDPHRSLPSPIAAIITCVDHVEGFNNPLEEHNFLVELVCFVPRMSPMNIIAPFSSTPKQGCWSWPPRS